MADCSSQIDPDVVQKIFSKIMNKMHQTRQDIDLEDSAYVSHKEPDKNNICSKIIAQLVDENFSNEKVFDYRVSRKSLSSPNELVPWENVESSEHYGDSMNHVVNDSSTSPIASNNTIELSQNDNDDFRKVPNQTALSCSFSVLAESEEIFSDPDFNVMNEMNQTKRDANSEDSAYIIHKESVSNHISSKIITQVVDELFSSEKIANYRVMEKSQICSNDLADRVTEEFSEHYGDTFIDAINSSSSLHKASKVVTENWLKSNDSNLIKDPNSPQNDHHLTKSTVVSYPLIALADSEEIFSDPDIDINNVENKTTCENVTNEHTESSLLQVNNFNKYASNKSLLSANDGFEIQDTTDVCKAIDMNSNEELKERVEAENSFNDSQLSEKSLSESSDINMAKPCEFRNFSDLKAQLRSLDLLPYSQFPLTQKVVDRNPKCLDRQKQINDHEVSYLNKSVSSSCTPKKLSPAEKSSIASITKELDDDILTLSLPAVSKKIEYIDLVENPSIENENDSSLANQIISAINSEKRAKIDKLRFSSVPVISAANIGQTDEDDIFIIPKHEIKREKNQLVANKDEMNEDETMQTQFDGHLHNFSGLAIPNFSNRPPRMGLSKKQRVKSLHDLCIVEKRQIKDENHLLHKKKMKYNKEFMELLEE